MCIRDSSSTAAVPSWAKGQQRVGLGQGEADVVAEVADHHRRAGRAAPGWCGRGGHDEPPAGRPTRIPLPTTRVPPTAIGLWLSLIHISEPTRLLSISYAVFCLKKKKNNTPQKHHIYLFISNKKTNNIKPK